MTLNIKQPICHTALEPRTLCLHCQNVIWRMGKFANLYDWGDQFGNICNDGFFHVPQKLKKVA